MANQPVKCGLQPPTVDFCPCGCDCTGSWCGNPECWTKHFGFPESHQEKLSANYRASELQNNKVLELQVIRATEDPKSRLDRGNNA